MCYPVFVSQEHCESGHPQDVRLCWRQCQARSVESYQTGRWNNLCAKPRNIYPDIQIYSPTATANKDCATCDRMEKGDEAQNLKTKIRALMEPYKVTEHAIEAYEEQFEEIRL